MVALASEVLSHAGVINHFTPTPDPYGREKDRLKDH